MKLSGTVKSLLSGLFLLLVLLLLHSCIEPFDPEIEKDYSLVSIEGSLVKGENEHRLIISRTAPLVYPEFKPIYNCIVAVVDEENNQYYYQQKENGTYSLTLSDELLKFGSSYQLQITTPDGVEYRSDFEELVKGAEVDTFYYQLEEVLDKITGEELRGLQFYIDLKAPDTTSRYYRWKIEETYEFTSVSPVSYYRFEDGTSITPDDPLIFYRCWKTMDVRQLFLSNTINLVVNEKKKIPLQFVTGKTDRLKYKYSPLVKQYTLSEGAYNYWQKAKNELQESGGLYSQQPGKSITNIYNVNDSTEEVLGYFWVSHMTSQRMFVEKPEDLEVTGDQCMLIPYDPVQHERGPWPRYFYNDMVREVLYTGSQPCMNCTVKGGKTSPPDFWE